VTAPDNRRRELLTQLGPIFRFAVTMPAELRDSVVQGGLEAERTIGPLRGNDDALCRGGMAEMQVAMDAMKRAGKEPEAVSVPGMPGKTVLLTSGNQYKPQFRGAAEWQPKRAALRSDLPTIAASLLTPSPAKP
jgi:hypothetical protein